MAETINTDKLDNVATNENSAPVSTAESEMVANLNLEQLSYICEYCGKINSISSPNCVRCGKRRPRSEYLKAMNKINNANTIKAQYIEEQAKIAADQETATQQQLVRLVERRVADEKAQIMAQEALRFEQEKEEIKKNTARDAVMRIIATERAADEKVKNANMRVEEVINGRNRQIEEQIATEREKVLYAAAKRLVSERTGIETAAEDRISAERKNTERKAQETIDSAIDEAEKEAARKAVLKVIAAEQSSSDRAKLEREAIHRAALERVTAEKQIIEANAYSKFAIEREAIERAFDERIKAEREMLYGRRDAVSSSYGAQNGATGTMQPLTIVPYVNPQQPLYQYNTIKQVYRFVPDANVAVSNGSYEANAEPTYINEPKAKKQKKSAPKVQLKGNGLVRAMAILIAIFGILSIIMAVVDVTTPLQLRFAADYTNISLLTAILGGVDNAYCNTVIAAGAMGYISAVGAMLFVVGAAIGTVLAIVRIFTAKANAFSTVIAAIQFVGALALAIGLFVTKATDFSNIAAGLIIALALSLAILVFAIIGTVKSNKIKKTAVEVRA